MSAASRYEFSTKRTSRPGPVKPGLDYYRNRADDYTLRHGDQTGKYTPPPDYYLDCGDIYARRFTQELRPRLSPLGQAWIDRTFLALQRQMEQQRQTQPKHFARLEEDTRAFRNFAYGLHAQAYIQCGVGDLPLRDLMLIAHTPRLRDLLTPAGIRQVLLVTAHLLQTRWHRFVARLGGPARHPRVANRSASVSR